jgi:hypothetical protein
MKGICDDLQRSLSRSCPSHNISQVQDVGPHRQTSRAKEGIEQSAGTCQCRGAKPSREYAYICSAVYFSMGNSPRHGHADDEMRAAPHPSSSSIRWPSACPPALWANGTVIFSCAPRHTAITTPPFPRHFGCCREHLCIVALSA